MRSTPVAIGALCGATLALGGIILADLSSEPAEAQSPDRFVTQSEFAATDRANQRRIAAARRSAVNNFNLLGKYLAPLNEVIGVDVPEGVIRQERGTGTGGLPSSVIADGAISEPKLTPELAAKINQPGPAGPAGPAGPQGPAGAAGPAFDPRTIVEATSTPSTIGPGSNVIEDATCPDGTYPISGGWEGNNTGLTAANQSRAVDLSGDGVDDTWRVQIRNDATIDATTNSIAYCVPI